MSRVVPSQIVAYVDSSLAYFLGSAPRGVTLHPSICGALNGLLRLIEQLPNSLLPSEPKEYADFVQSQESIRFAVAKALGQSALSDMQTGPPQLHPDAGGKPSQVQVIRDALAACPDEVPPRHSQELSFVGPADFRDSLLVDLETTRSALRNGEWKAATVLSGSLVEALLVWAILMKPADIPAACSAAVSAGRLQKSPPADPLDWKLFQMVWVAEQLGLIETGTAVQADLARDFRNLIHPAKTIRTQLSCDRGTALAASAAVELVSRDLAARFT